jgi:hypothetical protein
MNTDNFDEMDWLTVKYLAVLSACAEQQPISLENLDEELYLAFSTITRRHGADNEEWGTFLGKLVSEFKEALV